MATKKKAVKKAAAPKKMHKMPNGKMMEGAKHEKTEGKKERMMEYGGTGARRGK